MGRLQLRIILSIYAVFACLSLCVMSVDVITQNQLRPSLGFLAIAFLAVSCFLAAGADWARVISAGFSAIVVIASLLVISIAGGFNAITFVSLVFALIFCSSGYLLYFSKPIRDELKERWIRRQEEVWQKRAVRL